MQEESITKMEFLLTLNDNIVVQRYFNVRNYRTTILAGVVEKLHLTMYAVFTKYNTEVHLLRVPNP